MNTKNYAPILFKQLLKIHRTEELDWPAKSEALYLLLQKVFLLATEAERIQFSNFFARISYTFQQSSVDKKTQFYLHGFRRMVREKKGDRAWPDWEALYELGQKMTAKVISEIWKTEPPDEVKKILPGVITLRLRQAEIKDFKSKIRVVVLSEDVENEHLICVDEESGQEVRVRYNLAERNENFNATIREIRQTFGFPVTVNLLDVEVDTEGILRPRAFVVEPDFLVDVTAIAECFQPEGAESMLYLLKKFMPLDTKDPLIVGQIANFLLDELMAQPEAAFDELFPKAFRLFPLHFSMMDDNAIRNIRDIVKGHFQVIQTMVKTEFLTNEIHLKNCYLEPTLLSETYGLQGRLDVFHQPETAGQKSSIVELKSGKPFMANSYGLSNNHFIQTILYDLLVKSVYGKETEPTNYILYSSTPERPLRYAPAVKAQQMEALAVRNQLVALEWKLAGAQPTLLSTLNKAAYPKVKGFHARDLELFERVLQELSPLERQYFEAFAAFIAREHRLAKIGIQGVETANGMAALWRNDFAEKEANFDIISYLRIRSNEADQTDPFLIFEKTDRTNPLANFRVGDLAALYPFGKSSDTALDSQVFKVTIVALQKDTVKVRLRSRQSNLRIFRENEFWNLEHDLLDSSFVGMYRGLFDFARNKADKRALLLTLRPPAEPEPVQVALPSELTTEQQKIFRKILASRDYFLLWGPPGTGKTSMMLKYLVHHWFHQTDENLLLLAYTNRAVDEICEAIENLGDHLRQAYLRIGSRYGTDERFQSQLLDRKIESAKTRKELLDILQQHRIFVATIASFQTRSELLQLKKFNRVIIDEASQILEPMLVGFLPQFDHFTLIGDHRQLPAVVVQDEKSSAVASEDLQKVGLSNLRNSLFERLFLRCEAEGWSWAYDKLSHQGRMHAEIMQFPNEHFYGGFLQILPEGYPGFDEQSQIVDFQFIESKIPLESLLRQRRVLVLPAPSDEKDHFQKTNRHEAALIAGLVRSFRNLYPENAVSIGIITPYRAQIALIRHCLAEADLNPDALTIDTVERYQGGARDIILISLCTNSDSQLASLTSLSTEGVDRKLNVALTRARRHLVLVGNPNLLKTNAIYQQLWERYGVEG